MEIARPVVVTAKGDAAAGVEGRGLELSIGGVTVRSLGWGPDGQWVFLGCCALDSPLVFSDGVADLERDEVARIDSAIRVLSSLLTVTEGAPFTVSSINPTVGLLGTPEELQPLAGCEVNIPAGRPVMRLHDPIELSVDTLKALADRLDGVELLAEAMSHQNALGRFSQLLRLLELAFGRGIGRFDGELQRFLRGGATRHWFTPAEIQGWVSSRPRVMHADRVDMPIWYQRHVELTVERLREAAVDVLFNKANWRCADDARRAMRVPRRGTLDQEAGFFMTRGLALRSTMHRLDPYGSFPLLAAGAERAVPFGLWATPNGSKVSLYFTGDPGAEYDVSDLEPFEVAAATVANGVVVVYAADDDTVRDPASRSSDLTDD